MNQVQLNSRIHSYALEQEKNSLMKERRLAVSEWSAQIPNSHYVCHSLWVSVSSSVWPHRTLFAHSPIYYYALGPFRSIGKIWVSGHIAFDRYWFHYTVYAISRNIDAVCSVAQRVRRWLRFDLLKLVENIYELRLHVLGFHKINNTID